MKGEQSAYAIRVESKGRIGTQEYVQDFQSIVKVFQKAQGALVVADAGTLLLRIGDAMAQAFPDRELIIEGLDTLRIRKPHFEFKIGPAPHLPQIV